MYGYQENTSSLNKLKEQGEPKRTPKQEQKLS